MDETTLNGFTYFIFTLKNSLEERVFYIRSNESLPRVGQKLTVNCYGMYLTDIEFCIEKENAENTLTNNDFTDNVATDDLTEAKMNKKNILTYSLGLFVIVIALSVALWSFVFTELSSPKDYQTLNVFITANSVERSYIEDALLSVDGVKKSNATLTAEKDEYYGAQLSSVGLFNCDLLI